MQSNRHPVVIIVLVFLSFTFDGLAKGDGTPIVATSYGGCVAACVEAMGLENLDHCEKECRKKFPKKKTTFLKYKFYTPSAALDKACGCCGEKKS